MPWSKDGNIRGPAGTPGASAPTDHGLLTGLGDDDHPQYQLRSEEGQANGYATLDSGILVPVAQLGSGAADATKFLRGDRTWQVPPGGNDPRLYLMYKTAAQAATGTIIMNVADLVFPVLASSAYHFEMWVDQTAAGGTSPTLNFSFLVPAGLTRFMARRRQMTSATAEVQSMVTAGSTGFGAGASVANTRHTFEGIIVVGATAGNVQLQVTMGGTSPTATFAQGSGGRAFKVA